MPKNNIGIKIFFVFLQLSLYYLKCSFGFANLNTNPQMALSKIRVQNYPSNNKFDEAKQAMSLITMIDLPTCRCVNNLLPGKILFTLLEL